MPIFWSESDRITSPIRYQLNRQPMELALCLVAYMPDTYFPFPEPTEKPLAIHEWFAAQAERYRAIGAWLMGEKLGISLSLETIKEIEPYIPDAIVCHKMMNLCQALHPRTAWCYENFPGQNGWLKMWCCVINSEFLAQCADDGIAEHLGWQDFPPALIRSKTEEGALTKENISRLSVSKTRGRPRKPPHADLNKGRIYPPKASYAHQFLTKAYKRACRNQAFAEEFYNPYVQALEDAEKKSRQPGTALQVGLVVNNELHISSKGYQIKKQIDKIRVS